MSSVAISRSSPADPFAIARDMRWGNPELIELEAEAELWLRTVLPEFFSLPFADHQLDLWAWLWAIERGVRPDEAYVAVWPRGGTKSTNGEAACVALGARRRRRFALYVSDTQWQANDHVANVEAMIAAPKVAELYPAMAMRALTSFGQVKGWKLSQRARLRTAMGFTVEALGLDAAARGIKVEEDRPDTIIYDDVDSAEDSPATVARKIRDITKKILPSGSRDVAVLVIQNAMHRRSIVSRLSGIAPPEDEVDFLQNRRVSGPVPALRDMTWEMAEQKDGSKRAVITGGEPTWVGQDLEVCQRNVDDWGLSAFLQEAQHDVEALPGGMYDHIEFAHVEWGAYPPIIVHTVWLDPAVTDKDSSDAHAVQVDGLGSDDKIYRFFSWEQRSGPQVALELAIEKAYEFGSPIVGVETDQGGDLWGTSFDVAHKAVLKRRPDIANAIRMGKRREIEFRGEKAGEGHGSKVHRQQQQLHDYERGGIIHVVGTHQVLERALKRFPKTKPLDLADASWWSRWWLREAMSGGVSQMQDRRLRGRR